MPMHFLPLAEANEARLFLSEIVPQANDDAKRRFGYKKLLEADQQAAADPTMAALTASRYLAAMRFTWFLLKISWLALNKLKLSLPLKKSLPAKERRRTLLCKRLTGYGL